MAGQRRTQEAMRQEAQTLEEQEFDQRLQWVMAEMQRLGYPVRVISRRRTAAQQAEHFARGRTKPGAIVTEKSGKPGDESLHQLGRAVDFAFVGRRQPWDLLGKVAKQYGLEWGGDWTTLVDRPHVQLAARNRVFAGGPVRGVTDPTSLRVTAAPAAPAAPPAQAERRPPILAGGTARAAEAPEAARPNPRTLPPLAQVPPDAGPFVTEAVTNLNRRRTFQKGAHAGGVTDPASVKITEAPVRGRDIALPAEATAGPPAAPAPPGGPGKPASWPEVIAQLALDEGVPPALAVGVAEWENEGFNPALVSDAGAIGLMQLKQVTAEKHGVNPQDPTDNIRGGLRELKELRAKYGGDVNRVLAAYHLGETGAAAVPDLGTDATVQAYLMGTPERPGGVLGRVQKYADIGTTLPSAQTQQQQQQTQQPPPQQPPPEGPKIGPGPPEWWQTVRTTANVVPTTIGGIVGGTTGLALTLPSRNPYLIQSGTFFGATAGAGAGAGGGETFMVGLEMLLNKLGVPGFRPITREGAANRITSATNLGLLAEGGGQALGAGAQVAAAPFAPKVVPWLEEARQMLGENVILPAQATTSRVLRTLQDLFEASFMGGTAPAARRATQQRVGEAKVKQVGETLAPEVTPEAAGQRLQAGLPPSAVTQAEQRLTVEQQAAEARRAAEAAEQRALAQRGEQAVMTAQTGLGPPVGGQVAGQTAKAAREEAVKTFRAEERAVWSVFEETARGVNQEATPRLDAVIEGITQRSKGTLLPNASATAARRVADMLAPEDQAAATIMIGGKPAGPASELPASLQEAILKGIDAPEPTLTAVDFARTVSDLGTLARTLQEAAKKDPVKFSKQAGWAKQLAQAARRDLADQLGELGTSTARQAYEAATGLSREGNRRLFNKTVLKLAADDPDKIYNVILRPDNAQVIRRIEAAVGPEAMRTIRAGAYDRLIERDLKTGAVNWAATVRRLTTLKGDTLQTLFPGAEVTGLRRFAAQMFEAEQRAAQVLAETRAAVAGVKQGVAAETAAAEQRFGQAAAQDAAAIAAARRGVTEAKAQPDLLKGVRGELEPAKVPSSLLTPNNVATIRAVRAAVGDEAFAPTQRVVMDDLVRADPKTGRILWNDVQTRLGKIDRETLDAMYPGGHAEQVRQIVNLMAKLEQRGGPGSLTNQSRYMLWLGETGLLTGLAWQFSLDPKTVIAVGVMAPIMSRIMASKTGSRWLAEGLTLKPGTPEAIAAVTRLVAFMARDAEKAEQEGGLGLPLPGGSTGGTSWLQGR